MINFDYLWNHWCHLALEQILSFEGQTEGVVVSQRRQMHCGTVPLPRWSNYSSCTVWGLIRDAQTNFDSQNHQTVYMHRISPDLTADSENIWIKHQFTWASRTSQTRAHACEETAWKPDLITSESSFRVNQVAWFCVCVSENLLDQLINTQLACQSLTKDREREEVQFLSHSQRRKDRMHFTLILNNHDLSFRGLT